MTTMEPLRRLREFARLVFPNARPMTREERRAFDAINDAHAEPVEIEDAPMPSPDDDEVALRKWVERTTGDQACECPPQVITRVTLHFDPSLPALLNRVATRLGRLRQFNAIYVQGMDEMEQRAIGAEAELERLRTATDKVTPSMRELIRCLASQSAQGTDVRHDLTELLDVLVAIRPRSDDADYLAAQSLVSAPPPSPRESERR